MNIPLLSQYNDPIKVYVELSKQCLDCSLFSLYCTTGQKDMYTPLFHLHLVLNGSFHEDKNF